MIGALKRWLGPSKGARTIEALPDRKLMAEVYLPALARRGGRILMIGCRGYNRADLAPLMAHGAEVWTTDIDPGAARWGVPGRHRTGDACEIDRLFADMTFETILCNGILGHGVDTVEQQTRCLAAMAAIMPPGGVMLLGWNTDRIADPVPSLTDTWFEPRPLDDIPARIDVEGVTHVYDLMVRRPHYPHPLIPAKAGTQ